MRLSPLTLSAVAILAASAQANPEEVFVRQGFVRNGAAPAPAASQVPPSPVNGSDNCATPDPLGSATGVITFDLTAATTGTEGQTSFTGGYCNYGCSEYGTGQVAVLTDVWFSWTAPATGVVRLSSCGVAGDTKIAVYNGPTCPTGTTTLGCSDDYHIIGNLTTGLFDSIVYFNATAGQPYLIQVGQSSFNLTTTPPIVPLPGFAGSFSIDVNPQHEDGTTAQDDGQAEYEWPLGAAANVFAVAINRYADVGDVTTVTGVQVCWGWAASPNWVGAAGTPAYVALWSDPNNDGNPTDAVLVEQVATTIQNPGTDTYVSVPFTMAHTLNGVYFVGYGSQRIGANAVASSDCSGCNIQPGTSWRARGDTVSINLASLATLPVPPAMFETANGCQAQGAATYDGGFHATYTIRPVVQLGPPPVGTPECFGDGTGAACPCGNTGAAGRGCANSGAGSTGAVLTATGVASISADTVTITCTDLTGPGLFFSATGVLGSPIAFGDGILCAGVGIVRMGVVFPTGNAASYPGGLTPNPVHIAGGIGAAGTFHFQCWYRDAVAFCTAATYNMSNGLSMAWVP